MEKRAGKPGELERLIEDYADLNDTSPKEWMRARFRKLQGRNTVLFLSKKICEKVERMRFLKTAPYAIEAQIIIKKAEIEKLLDLLRIAVFAQAKKSRKGFERNEKALMQLLFSFETKTEPKFGLSSLLLPLIQKTGGMHSLKKILTHAEIYRNKRGAEFSEIQKSARIIARRITRASKKKEERALIRELIRKICQNKKDAA